MVDIVIVLYIVLVGAIVLVGVSAWFVAMVLRGKDRTIREMADRYADLAEKWSNEAMAQSEQFRDLKRIELVEHEQAKRPNIQAMPSSSRIGPVQQGGFVPPMFTPPEDRNG